MKASFFCGILILLLYTVSYGQKDTEFWFVAPEVTSQHGDSPIYLRLTSFAEASHVKITQPAQPAFSISVYIPAHGTYSVDLTPYMGFIENKPANQVNHNGLLIQASTPITAYYDEANEWNSDIFALKGKNSLGTEFLIPAQNSFNNAARFDGRNAFDIVATENNTTIHITPSSDITGHAGGITFSIVLNRGETYSAVAVSQAGSRHLDGSKVTSDKPIAVTVKDDSVEIGTAIDLNGDQIVPVNIIGREYIVVRGYLSGYDDQVCVLSASDNNNIYLNGSAIPSYTANAGKSIIIAVPSSNPVIYLKTDYPVYILHLTGFGAESGSALIPPIRCTGSREVAFTRSTSQRLSLTIVTEEGAQGSFAIDGNSSLVSASEFTKVPGTSTPTMVSARILFTVSQISAGSHIITNNKGNFHLGIIIESNQQGCSYGYFSDFSDVYLGPDATICSGVPKILDAGAGKQSYDWSTGDTTQTISVSTSGTYLVTANSSGCTVNDTIIVTALPLPVVDAGTADSVEQATSVILSATASGSFPPTTYTWNPQNLIISGDLTLMPTTVPLTRNTVFTIRATDSNGCSLSDSVLVVVDPGPCAMSHIITVGTSVCAGSVVELNSKKALSYQWNPGMGLNDSTIQNTWVIIDSTRTFYLNTTEYSKNLITNPGFEMGNTGFGTDYTYCNSDNCLWTMGDYGYSVGTDAGFFANNYFSGRDHTTGSGNFLIVNGGRSSLKVWRQTVAVSPNTTYTLGLWISRMNTFDTAQIRISINGSQLGDIFTPPAATNIWKQEFRSWNSGIETSAAIEIVDVRSSVTGNDFGIDDITFGKIMACLDSVTITASRKVSLGQDTVISPGQQIALVPGGGPFDHINWSTGDTTHTELLTEAGKYQVQATDPIGCISHDSINVRSSNSYVVFPNAFTPNTDGYNDFFRPQSNNVVKFHMAIYNRWGQLVFETDNVENGWNGKLSGKDCAVGLFVYVATYELKYQEDTKSARGSFSLIR